MRTKTPPMSNTVHIPGPQSLQEHTPPLPTTHVILIPGNPGLAEYYRLFLTHLNSLLNLTSPPLRDRQKSHGYTFTAFSLAGFEIEAEAKTDATHAWWERRKRLFNLDEQSCHVHRLIDEYVVERRAGTEGGKPRVILLGHSIGAYLLLQHLSAHLRASRDYNVPYEIAGGILLFPTIIDLAQSSNGRRFGWLIALLGTWLGALVALLAWFASGEWCKGWERKKGIIGYVARNWRYEATWELSRFMRLGWRKNMRGAVTTLNWLGSGWGVWETLYLARDELRTVTTNKWDELVWGSATALERTNPRHPRLLFYFGQKDHWVADRTRDDLIQVRGWRHGEDWRPRMEIAEPGIGHAFCLRHSEVIAEKVAEYVRWISEAQDP